MNMKYYCLERPKHCPMEDAHFAATFEDYSGKEWGLFLIADGLTGSNGTLASTLAAKYIGAKILKEMKSKPELNYSSLLNETIISANEMLCSLRTQIIPDRENSQNSVQTSARVTARTTLDVVLVSSNKEHLYIGHLGDGQVYLGYNNELKPVTKIEGRGDYGPRNYLGAAYVADDPRPIQNRINLIEPLKSGLPKPKFLVLATDGLTSRVTPKALEDICKMLDSYTHPADILEELRQEVELPRSMLLNQPNTADLINVYIYNIPGISVDENMPKERLVEYILKIYKSGENQKLTERIDSVLKNDDATIILVDLEDLVTSNLNSSQVKDHMTVPELREKLANLTDATNAYKRIVESSDLALERMKLHTLLLKRSEKKWEERYKKEGDFAVELYEKRERLINERNGDKNKLSPIVEALAKTAPNPPTSKNYLSALIDVCDYKRITEAITNAPQKMLELAEKVVSEVGKVCKSKYRRIQKDHTNDDSTKIK